MSEVIVFPEYGSTKNAVEKLRTELSMLMLEYDELRFVECKNIEMVYIMKCSTSSNHSFKSETKTWLNMDLILI